MTPHPTLPDEDAEASTTKPLRIYDGHHRKTNRPTIMTSMRIFKDQRVKLIAQGYDGNSSVLIRLLLDKFFADEIPDVREKYQQLLNNATKE